MKIIKLFSFLYFFTLHADQLSIPMYLWNFRVNNLIAFLLFVFLVAYRRGILPKIDFNILIGISLIVLSLVISTLLSAQVVRSLGYLLLAIYTFAFYFYLVYVLSETLGFINFFKLYVSSFLFVGLYALIQLVLSILGFDDPFANQKLSFMVRPNAFAYEPSFYALYMTPIVFYFNHLFLVYRSRERKLKVVLFNVLFLISTSTATVFSYIIYAFLNLRKFHKLFPYILFILVLIFLSYPFFSDIYNMFFFKFFRWDFYNHWSFRERWGQIVNSFIVFESNPIFGVGLGGVGMYIFQRYDLGENFYLRSTDHFLTFKSFDPMNVTTEVLASQGVFGFICYSIFLFLFFYRARLAVKISDSYELAVINSLIMSSIIMLIVLQFNQGIFRTYIWVHLAVLYSATNHILSGKKNLKSLF